MSIIGTHHRERIPAVYIAAFGGDDGGGIQRQFRNGFRAIDPAAGAAPGVLALDRIDYGRLDTEALNTFMVDTDTDALVWAYVVAPGDALEFHAAIAPYPKVAHENRVAEHLTARLPLPLTEELCTVASMQVIAAALAERAANRPVPAGLVMHFATGLEHKLQKKKNMPSSLRANVLETLSRLSALKGAPGTDTARLRYAVDLNVRLCRQIGANDPARHVRLLKTRAGMLTRLGTKTGEASDILKGIDALRDAAVIVSEDLGLARLDLQLAVCKAALGRLQDDRDLLADARDLLNWAIPYLYRNLAVEDWARAQAELAEIDFDLMMCATDAESGKTYAFEAIDAVSEALEFYNPGNFPLAWAKVTHLRDRITDAVTSNAGRKAPGETPLR